MNAYGKAGVDVTAGYKSVERMKKHIKRTQRPETLSEVGGFGGLFDLSQQLMTEPVLVSGTDGVGTKLLIAIEQGKHATIGIDCVAMCVNDVIAQGALPLFFLDYIATSKVEPEIIEEIVAGVAEGCVQAGAALIGGETAEMPDMYHESHYDVAGFTVGLVEKNRLIKAENVQAEDVLIGLAASGIHSNGFSLVRKIYFKDQDFSYASLLPELAGKTLGEELLTPTKIYVNSLKPLLQAELINGIAHITGGGFVENVPRMLPTGLGAVIEEGTWPALPIFASLAKHGKIPSHEMYEIFNMGIGMMLAVAPDKVEEVQALLKEQGDVGYVIGKVVSDPEQKVIIKEHSQGTEARLCD
ncbi:phosphoribosylformylglycinamidine cyclo-ligase [Vagococcus salmoninarum]|uniref:Phosphoribosylformylglycinamidine cyclo-ligase n=1 Tax=Vagococcus salmoninarum TaxID=2739 RepID=A0A429ZSX1_9ENTE|nr:phosphoribosylformylglycinamidine cyclo-ligase [Vagococcus salmoninarum]MBE9388774.1 phosphoribosylformylglycinamidine cyclo-ligase [Vagococcus salmoninarum]RST96719.1 phosphoribosylformylglycinamidine cyclo-ligase [Vagococcus salmoninarum]